MCDTLSHLGQNSESKLGYFVVLARIARALDMPRGGSGTRRLGEGGARGEQLADPGRARRGNSPGEPSAPKRSVTELYDLLLQLRVEQLQSGAEPYAGWWVGGA